MFYEEPGEMETLRKVLHRIEGKPVVTVKYYVVGEFPFKLIHESDILGDTELYKELTMARISRAVALTPFIRRLSAEQYRLHSLKIHYETIGDIKQAKFYAERHKNIKEEHPEWVI